MLLLPSLERLLGNPFPPHQLPDWHPYFCLFQYPHHLFHRKAFLLHGKAPLKSQDFAAKLTLVVVQKTKGRSSIREQRNRVD